MKNTNTKSRIEKLLLEKDLLNVFHANGKVKEVSYLTQLNSIQKEITWLLENNIT